MTEIIAEISGNHGGVLNNALRLIQAAHWAAADAVKFQCFEIEQLATKRVGVKWEGKVLDKQDLLALYEKTHTPKEWFPELISAAESIGINWLSSVFDVKDIQFLEKLGCPRYKISAYEMFDFKLIQAALDTGKPIILSVRPRPGVTILQATGYSEDRQPLGLSDHSLGNAAAFEAARLHAPMIERHLKLKDVICPDDEFSLAPNEFKEMVDAIRYVQDVRAA